MKRLVAISDLHCGHMVGLTHPDFDACAKEGDSAKHFQTRRACWDFYTECLTSLQPIDILLVNGDAIDGKGDRSGGTEQLTCDRSEQVEMATAAIVASKAKAVYMTYGTGYHVGRDEDWEGEIARQVEAKHIGGHDWLKLDNIVFDYKHKLSNSQVPHGRHTSIAREHLWNLLWSEHSEQPIANIIIRSHVHYFNYCGGSNWLAVSTPALQAKGTKYGAREMSGTVDFGLVWFEVTENTWGWGWKILKASQQAATVFQE